MNRRDFIGGCAAGAVAAGLPAVPTRDRTSDLQELCARWIPILNEAAAYGAIDRIAWSDTISVFSHGRIVSQP